MPIKPSRGRFYITTPIYYVNDVPHIGHAYCTIAADVLARYHRARGDKVFFLMGTDENAQKNVESALNRHPERSEGSRANARTSVRDSSASPQNDTRRVVQQYVDQMSAKWKKAWEDLDISNDDFIRTTEPRHVKYVEKFWGIVKRGDIYKGRYDGLYCTSCESYKTESDLINGLCPDHKRKPEKLSEENYFFKLSAYRKKLLDHIKKHPEFIQPVSRRNEMVAYIRDHAQDFSISRKNLEWGIPVPGDPTQTIYVWFDALLNYVSAVSPPSGGTPPLGGEQQWWPADLQLVGKDIIKFHCAYWPAMLMSVGLPLPHTVFAHGFFTVDGQKMSKTIGNVVDPISLAKKYGNDVLRYYLLREIRFGEDGDFSEVRLRERYNGELANGLGNLVARVVTMVERYAGGKIPSPQPSPTRGEGESRKFSSPSMGEGEGEGAIWQKYESHMSHFALDRALDTVWNLISQMDKLIDKEQPWVLAKKSDKKRLNMVLSELVGGLGQITAMLQPFMPETAQKIAAQLKQGKKSTTLFPRLITPHSQSLIHTS